MSDVKFDYSLLIERMNEMNYTKTKLAKEMSIGRTTLNEKLSNNTLFKQNEIKLMCKLLKIKSSKINDYFFKEVVQKTVQK
ncbi:MULTISPECIES: DUF739 family protein [Staphylococcaceae]|uniref:DUF739 domain-containing protein n=1 Tax=Macrococcoides bohemicum TaxID=1903056 RepID=A0A328A7U4_9STAP|nr:MULTISPECIES: DUF739 family protein [Macrococcus]RAK50447.1 DUF739 domain-containing protein [Macrococcus bohemicus]UTH15203.1 DUF739 family protein [Macrococcus epidermidis]